MISLIGLIRNLSKDVLEAKLNLNKYVFHKNVQPIWESFKIVHKDYKESLIKYIKLINENKPLEELVTEIRQDSIYSADLRSDLKNLIEIASDERSENKKLIPFLLAINEYIGSKQTMETVVEPVKYIDSNIIRYQLLLKLSHLDSENGKIAKNLIENTLSDLQNKYNIVDREYYRLKNSVRTSI